MTCKHEFLMRHNFHGEIWWQCQEGCDFLFRAARPAAESPAGVAELNRKERFRALVKRWRSKAIDLLNDDYASFKVAQNFRAVADELELEISKAESAPAAPDATQAEPPEGVMTITVPTKPPHGDKCVCAECRPHLQRYADAAPAPTVQAERDLKRAAHVQRRMRAEAAVGEDAMWWASIKFPAWLAKEFAAVREEERATPVAAEGLRERVEKLLTEVVRKHFACVWFKAEIENPVDCFTAKGQGWPGTTCWACLSYKELLDKLLAAALREGEPGA